MSQSSRLALRYLAAAQAQKHVTVNESLLRLDALVQLSAKSANTSTQPAAPTDGDIYVLPTGKSGAAWSAMANGALAYYRDGAWEELTPQQGWRCFVDDEACLYARNASAWVKLAGADEHRLIFTPGGDGVVSIYRIDTARTQNPRTATISSVSTDTITLSTDAAGLFFSSVMAGVSYVRVWNTTKTPDQSAWVKAAPASNQLRVIDAAAIASWSASDTIQIGDPTDQTPGRVIALDISPMMQAVLGRVFRQKAVLLKGLSEGLSPSRARYQRSWRQRLLHRPPQRKRRLAPRRTIQAGLRPALAGVELELGTGARNRDGGGIGGYRTLGVRVVGVTRRIRRAGSV